MASKKTVKLFYDVISPYSWIAFEVLIRYKQKWNMKLVLKPMFLGGVMQAADNTPPAFVPSKGTYMFQDLHRLGKHFKVPIKIPKNPAEVLFQKGSLQAMRFVTAVDVSFPESTENLSRELWLRIWSRDEDITQPDSLVQAAKASGLNEAVITDALLKMKDNSIKDKLKAITTEALEHGAFGAPTIVAEVNNTDQMLFGSDRFHILADLLGEQYVGPLTELAKSKL
ncbi:glutathione S-transferase kappa 1-like [Liolophura sinensis]|uniref:glutathione S-transferase kappa 1-like n=1 Tax=Liolophura sinensis TaxID=3198878 RepID=UPI0031583357